MLELRYASDVCRETPVARIVPQHGSDDVGWATGGAEDDAARPAAIVAGSGRSGPRVGHPAAVEPL